MQNYAYRKEIYMKSFFGRKKNPDQNWDNENDMEFGYDDADEGFGEFEYYDSGTEYYEEEATEEYVEEYDAEAYDAEGYVEEEYYEETPADEYYEAEEGEYYEPEASAEYYEAEDADAYYESEEGEIYYEEDTEYYVEDAGEYYEEDYEEQDAYVTASVKKASAPKKAKTTSKSRFDKEDFLGFLTQKLDSMDAMDKMMLIVGVAVLVLAIITGSVFVGRGIVNRQVSGFVSVGTYLDGITTIGGEGIAAVADAHMDRLEVDKSNAFSYEENDLNRQVGVKPQFVSIQKDLKIKFTNKKSEKLVANVPFSVVVKTPDGKEQIWSDDDMDGIIYKTGIAPGKYEVAMEALSDKKYERYIITTDVLSTTVKKDIAYSKVDVDNEVKQESEIDASIEDTKKNDTKVESTIADTVAWVESKVIPVTYHEVSKSTIKDPLTVAMARKLILVTEEGSEPPAEDPTPEPPTDPTPEPPADPTPEPPADPTPEPPADPTPAPTEAPAPTDAPTAAPTAAPTQAPATPAPTAAPTQAPALVKGTITVENKELTGPVGTNLTTKATHSGFTSNNTVEYRVTSTNNTIAKAVITQDGKITVTPVKAGTAKITVYANYKGASSATQAYAIIDVTITSGDVKLELNDTRKELWVGENFLLEVKVKGAATTQPTIKVATSNHELASLSANETKKDVRVYANKEGTATITFTYTEGGRNYTATCEVVMRKHPKDDTTTLLKNTSGEQIYVLENGNYREARNADYYKASKFFLKGAVKYTGWQNIGGKVYYFTANGDKVTGRQVIQGATYTFGSDGALTNGSGSVGIDVSKWNGSIDWGAVRNSGVSYAIIRCGYRGSTNGKLVEDPKFRTNIKGATNAGLKVGVYFFSQAVNEVEAIEEASMVLGLIEDYNLSFPVFLDVEASGGRGDKIDKDTRTAICKAFCETIQSAGYKAGVYSNKLWLESKINVSALSKYRIWLAQYAAKPTYTGRYDIWQYTAKGNVNGISGDVDMNISY